MFIFLIIFMIIIIENQNPLLKLTQTLIIAVDYKYDNNYNH